MRVVPSEADNDCGICAIACALDVSYEQARDMIFGYEAANWKTKSWATQTRHLVGALRVSNLCRYFTVSLIANRTRTWAGLFKAAFDEQDGGTPWIRVIVKVTHRSYGKRNWHWVVVGPDGLVYDNQGFHSISTNGKPMSFLRLSRKYKDVSE